VIRLTFAATSAPLHIDRREIAAVYVSSSDPTITVIERRSVPQMYLVRDTVEDVLKRLRPRWRFWS
jgi:hypothetical protein